MAYISLEHVVKRYQMGELVITAVDDISFEIEKGEFVIVVGPSGAGKTTVLNILGGMDSCTGGTITVDGQVLDESYLNYEYDSAYGSDCMADLAYLDPQYVNREFTVPDGCIFVCGDNRNHSSDSRSAALGIVDARYVIGEVLLVFLPFNHLGLIK